MALNQRMSEQSFRDSLRAFNSNNRSSYISIPTSAASPVLPVVQSDDFCGMGRLQRYTAFMVMVGLSIFCFFVSLFSLPMIIISPSKFAIPFTFGSLLAIISSAFLKGFKAHLFHVFSQERWVFSSMYIGSLLLTLYFSLGRESNYIMTVLCSIIQLIALIWYLGSYAPGGTAALSFFTRWVTGTRSMGLPI